MGLEEKRGASEKRSVSGKENAADKVRRVAALAGVVLLVGLYLVTFVLAVIGNERSTQVLAVIGNERSTQLLRFCFGMTIFVPLFIWVVTWCVGVLFHKKTFASLNLLDSDKEERRRMEDAVARQMEADRQEIEK